MTFSTFATHLAELENISARLVITQHLAHLYHELSAEERQSASYLLLGRLVATYDSLEFQISTKLVIRALANMAGDTAQTDLFGQTSSVSTEEVMSRFKKSGDLGTVAQELRAQLSNQPTQDISLIEVYEELKIIAANSGSGSQDFKVTHLSALLSKLDPAATKYAIRIILGGLRLGFSSQTMIDALSWSMVGDKSERDLLEDAYNHQADIGRLANVYLAEPDAELRRQRLQEFGVEVGIPVMPALCQRLDSAEEMIAKMTEVLVEPKYDGIRVQIHAWKENGEWQIKSYTRSLEENTHQFPELQMLPEVLQVESCVLDIEAIGFDNVSGKLLPFQDTITRKRKHSVDDRAAEIPLKFFVFDVLMIDGKSVLEEKMRDRKELLKNIFKKNETFLLTEYHVTSKAEEIRHWHNHYLSEGLEGAVIKQIDAPYGSGRKGWQWVKIKEAEGKLGKLKDTLDVVVMGYYRGKGKRVGFGLGAFLVGILDSGEGSEGNVKTIAKIGTGLTDDQFRELKTRVEPLETVDQPANYHVAKALVPDVWVQPELVVEVAADEITNSPQHTAGFALRFPRLVKFRDDKKWMQITQTNELEGLK